MKDVPVYDPDDGHHIGDVRVCAWCGEVACLDWAPCLERQNRQARKAAWPPPEERR